MASTTSRGLWRDVLRFLPVSLVALFSLVAGSCNDDETMTMMGPDCNVVVDAPEGAVAGVSELITWSQTACGSNVRIELLRDGAVCDTIAESTPNDGTYDWTVSRCGGEATGYSIRIVDLESSTTGASDVFEILGAGTLRIVLDHVVSGAALEQNQFLYTTAEGNDFSVNTLRWVLSLLEVSGGEGGRTRPRQVQGPEVHLRDAFIPSSRSIEITDVPEGSYSSLSFVFGLTEEMNTADVTYTEPGLEDEWIAMAWPVTWGDGYHYMQLEGRFLPAANPTGPDMPYATHLGRRNAQNDPTFGTDPAPIPHFFTVTLPIDVTIGDGETWEVQVLMDVAEWYTNPNDIDLDDPAMANMIMMNTDVQDLFEANGASVFSVGTVSQVN